MSVDGRDESLGGGSEVGAEELPARQVPTQRGGGSGATAAELPPSDGDLIARMRGGDDGAYEELFRRHADAVRRYARTCCRDAHTADDLTAEVFARTLQAVRGGAGPDQAVRAYLLTTVRRVAAGWTKSARREQLVEDFALFAEQAAQGAPGTGGPGDTLDLGADVRAMHDAEQSLAMRAFRSLPERWQAVLWHTTVEEASPSAVAPLFGLTPNATAVLASRAREGLKQAYLQAHVSAALTEGGDCARYADRLGAYARGGLRVRAERGLRKHLEECARCRLAAGELKDVNAGIPALLPVAVIGWFAAGYAVKAAGVVAGGAVGAAGAGAAAAATGGSAAGAGAAGAAGTAGSVGASGVAGASGGAGAAGGGAGAGGSGVGAGAASEGLGLPAKAAIAAGLAVATAAGVVFAFAGDDSEPQAGAKPAPRAAAPVVPDEPEPPAAAPSPEPSAAPPRMRVVVPPASPEPPASPRPSAPAAPSRAPSPKPPKAPASPKPSPKPSAKPSPKPSPRPSSKPPEAAPRSYELVSLRQSVFGDHSGPELRTARSSWVWQRWGLAIGGRDYAHGITVHSKSAVTVDLNRPCTSFSARVGVDDMSMGLGTLRFSVWADGARLWRSPAMAVGDAAVPVEVPLRGRESLRLVVEREEWRGRLMLADWAGATITCR
ncbi:sigma-70 family RNA polymerase sigma factor [Streptomyces sp. NPDC101132]|uniref:sigma-70 family RNA polymerase sigma factor n=1 Tax=Streptomyces sp. NPDC101132 TaxID=3366110 RepID=UPI00381843C1